jgi:dihydrofolate synthase/folylpolyglutamate synthase
LSSYQETLDFLYSRLPMFHRIGAAAYKDNLDNTLALSNLTGRPEQSFPSIHIAGTNGKGSVSSLIASILQESGLKVALFTSPHLKDFRERIRVNGSMIPKAEVVRFVKQYRKEFESIEPSFFEWTFSLAMSYFAAEKPDIAVVETGLGGRLDSTNIITPVLSLITNIGWDHMSLLGDTLEKIATEKAGIIKPLIPVVIGESQAGCDKVFTQFARDNKSQIVFADQRYNAERFTFSIKPSPSLTMDVFREGELWLSNLKSSLAGLYQLKNTPAVMMACEMLNELGYEISEEHIRSGFAKVTTNTGLRGRWQMLRKKPLTLCDTGHNLNGLREVVRQLRLIPHEQLHIVLGMVVDKDLDQILEILPRQAVYYFCKPDIPRGLDAETLAAKALEAGISGSIHESVQAALQSATEKADAADLIFVGGSTFVVAEVV